MNPDDIAQKLALLPEGVAESNMKSWRKAVTYYEKGLDNWEYEYNQYFDDVGKVAKVFSMNEQAKLFRAVVLAHTLLISTADEPDLRSGEPHVRVFFTGGFLTAQYGIDEERDKYKLYKRISDNIYFRTGNDAIAFLQPMLDLLWNQTQGKKNT